MKVKKIIYAVVVIIGVIVLAGALLSWKLQGDLDKLTEAPIKELDISLVKDGVYEGKYTAFPVSVEVRVTVLNEKITEIELVKHINGQGKAGEGIIEEVLNSQSLQAETISGATYSSKVILKAIEDALIKGTK